MSYPNLLAGGLNNLGTFAPYQLWAGESDIVTSQGVASGTIRQFAVLMRAGSATTLVEWDGSAGKAIGFAAQPAVSGGPVPYFVGGSPNHTALIWPSSCDTLEKRKAAFDGTNIQVGSLL